MADKLSIALAQMNQRVGDLETNAAAMLGMRRRATGADLLVCPELQVIGYPPEDLVLKPEFVRRAHAWAGRTLNPSGLFLTGVNAIFPGSDVWMTSHRAGDSLVPVELAISPLALRGVDWVVWYGLRDDEPERLAATARMGTSSMNDETVAGSMVMPDSR